MGFLYNHTSRLSSILIFLITCVIYAPAFHGEFIWDDNAHVLHIDNLKSLDGLKRIWLEPGATLGYYPALFSTFWVERHLFGDNPFGYHAVNILLHGSNAILLQQVLIRLGVPGAAWAAAIFALHPVHVESVAWITERKNCLSAFFYFLSLLAYLRFAGIGVYMSPLSAKIKNKSYIWAFIFFVLSVLSKTVTCTLPAVFLLFVWWKRKQLNWKQIRPTLPFFIVGFCLAIITYWVETRFVGASGAEWKFHWTERFLIGGKALWFYIGKIFWPQPLIFTYPRWDLNPTDMIQFIFPLSFLLFIIFLWRKRSKWDDGPLVGILFFAGTLTPALGFVDFYWMRFSFVADHLQYLASAGIIGTTTGLITWYAKKRWSAVKIAFPIILIILGVLTYKQVPIYHDSETLWKDTIKKNPNSWVAHNNLGSLLYIKGNVDKALKHYNSVIRIKPNDPLGYNNVATLLHIQGEIDKAIDHYKKALKINPNYTLALNNLAEALKKREGFVQATIHFKP